MNFLAYEVRGVIEIAEECTSYTSTDAWNARQSALDDAGIPHKAYHTLYGRLPSGEITAIGDFLSASDARDVKKALDLGSTALTADTAVTACAVWEAILEFGDDSTFGAFRNRNGVAETRAMVPEIARWIDKVDSESGIDFSDWPFDWEVIPRLLALLEIDPALGVVSYPPIKEAAETVHAVLVEAWKKGE